MTERPTAGLGASEVPAIAGLSPFATATDVWLEKVGLAPARAETPAMAAGKALERPILRLAGDRLGVTLRHNAGAVFHPSYPDVPLWATPDGYGVHRTLLAEVKLVGHRWSDWSDGPPDYVVAQARAQMACHPRAVAVVVIALLGSELRTMTVERDPAIERELVELATGWWRRHVVGELAPDPDGPSDAWAILRATAAVDARSERLALPDELATGRALIETNRQIAALEERADELRRELAVAAGEADLLGIGWTARWSDRASTSWKSVAMAAGATPEDIADYTTRTPSFGFRTHEVQA